MAEGTKRHHDGGAAFDVGDDDFDLPTADTSPNTTAMTLRTVTFMLMVVCFLNIDSRMLV